MKIVEDDSGRRYVVRKQSSTASLVRDPITGSDCYVANDRLEPVEGASTLETMAESVPDEVRGLITTVHDERTLGLLLYCTDHGPVRVRTLLAQTDYCESDLAGVLATLSAGKLLAETTVDGERGYRVTDSCRQALSQLRSPAADHEACTVKADDTPRDDATESEDAANDETTESEDAAGNDATEATS